MTMWVAVFARGGSKGLPGKNLLELGGKPLVAHSIHMAQRLEGVNRVICSTDSAEISEIAEELGAWVPFLRPSHLATDQSPELDSWKHLGDFLVAEGAELDDLFVSLPTVSPLRELVDVESAISLFRTSSADLVVSYTPARRSPWFNMVTRDSEGVLSIASSGANTPSRRQDSPEVFDLCTVVYVTTLRYVLNAKGLFDGTVTGVEIPPERAIDIDSQLDFDVATFLYERKRRSNG